MVTVTFLCYNDGKGVTMRKSFNKRFKEWKEYALNKNQHSPAEIDTFSDYPDIFESALQQNTSLPEGTVYNENFLSDLGEGIENFLYWYDNKSTETTPGKLSKIKNILLSLKTLEHHSIAEEMWRIDQALDVINGVD